MANLVDSWEVLQMLMIYKSGPEASHKVGSWHTLDINSCAVYFWENAASFPPRETTSFLP